MVEQSAERPRPLTGIGVLILKDGKALLARRRGSHGEGEYAFPGGHLEFGESFETCARREVTEETGIEIKNIRFQYLANVKKYGGKHYVHIGLVADWKAGEPQVLEPDKSEDWGWYDLNDLPSPLFEMCRLSFESLRSKENYFDS
jgi:8-oxo-dGTP diphosphatase